jgi:bacterioferritin-associated ferredoxin
LQGDWVVIVCSCNSLSDSQVRAAADQYSALRVTQVHSSLGCRPKCGQCFSTIKTVLAAQSTGAAVGATKSDWRAR